MGNQGYRVNGGVGFTIEEPKLKLNFSHSDNFQIIDRRKNPLSTDASLRLSNKLSALYISYSLKKKISVEISGNADGHSGFGTGTNIRLACIESLFKMNEIKKSRKIIQNHSGRGGTSGIGINTYFDGGLIFDVGRKGNLDKILPSNQYEYRNELPLKLNRLKMPRWELGICIPKKVKRISESEEIKFFRSSTPIEMTSIQEILYHVTFGLLPSVIESDFQTFCKAINEIQKCEWKKLEKSLYGSQIFTLEKSLFDFGAEAVGMSSLGPCLYFFSRKIDEVIESVIKNNNCTVFKTKMVNSGREFVEI